MPGLEIKCRHKIQGALHYCCTFTCVLMAALWFKILTAIDNTNKVIQARNSTIDVEVDNIDGLQTALRELRERWDDVYREAKQVALNMGIDVNNHHGLVGIRRGLREITPDTYRINVYYKAIDSVLVGLSVRY